MSAVISRRQFLRGDSAGRRAPVRPPRSLAEVEFLQRCDRCGDCVPACTEGVLITGDGGYPELDFSAGPCSFCGACAAACSRAAFRAGDVPLAWYWVAAIGDEACLAAQGVECRICAEQCEVRALRMRLQVGGVARPELSVEHCTGCGGCIGPCPTGAIRLQPTSPSGESSI